MAKVDVNVCHYWDCALGFGGLSCRLGKIADFTKIHNLEIYGVVQVSEHVEIAEAKLSRIFVFEFHRGIIYINV